ncbi:MAG: N-acetylmuramoyl-L-alanine amidase [Nitrospiraceae bacterium]|nr:N-acetylmuramoyl-L-alanine amidase [Nitrospiraceae bacterium]
MKGKQKLLFFPVVLLALLLGYRTVLGCQLEGIKIEKSAGNGHTQCLLVTDGQADFEEHALSNPKRVYVDLRDSTLKKGLQKGLKADGIIKNVRVAQFNSRVVRVVFEFENSPNVSISKPNGKRSGLVLDFSDGVFKKIENGNGSRSLTADTGNKNSVKALPSAIDRIRADLLKTEIKAGTGRLPEKTKTISTPLKAEKTKTVLAKMSLPSIAPIMENSVRPDGFRKGQIPFHKWRVVIDPGHGGKDPGTSGKDGRHEKQYTLAIALRLARLLRNNGYQVLLTRDNDYFVTLDNRAVMANRDRADIFVSIHINWSSNPGTRGITTYFLNWTDDNQANRVAARENQITLRRQKEARTSLGYILASLELEGKRDGSLSLANYIEHSVISSVHGNYPGEPSLGVKGALFYVLVGDKMPATLTEVSFLSNSRDEELLQDPSYLDEVAKGMAAGIENYFRSAPVRRTLAQDVRTYRKIAEK